MSLDYNYQPINFEDLILFDENSILEENVIKYIPSYILFATPARIERKSIAYIMDKIKNLKKYHYANFFRKGTSNVYLGPIIKENSFQLFYIDKTEKIFVSIPDLLINKGLTNTKDAYRVVIDYRKLNFKDKIQETPFFLRIEIYLLWVMEIKDKEDYSTFLHSYMGFLLEVYSHINIENNPTLSSKIKAIFKSLFEMKYQDEQQDVPPRYLYSFLITPEYMRTRAIESKLRSSAYQQFVWFTTPEEAIAYNLQNYHIGSLICGRINSLTGNDILKMNDTVFFTPKEIFSSLSAYVQKDIDISSIKSIKDDICKIKHNGLTPLTEQNASFATDIFELLMDDLSLCNLVPEINNLYSDNKERLYYVDIKKNILCPLHFMQEPQAVHRYRTSKKRNAIELYNLYVLYHQEKFELMNFKNVED